MTKFVKGMSGNPAGRPRGARDKRQTTLEKMLRDASGDVASAVIDAAQEGDMAAARMILDRTLPARKDSPITIDLPPIATSADLLAANETILGAVARGEITPSEADAVMGLLERHRRTIETADLAERVEAIERKLA